jgi:hypothetical protein
VRFTLEGSVHLVTLGRSLFEGDCAPEPLVDDLIDSTHAPGPELPDNAISTLQK